MKKLLASAAMAAAMTIGGASIAHATVYNLNVTDLTPGNYGTVTVTGSGISNTLTFDIELASGVFFNQAGGGDGPDDIWFDLVGNPTVTIAGLTSNFTAVSPQSAAAPGAEDAAPFGSWDYVIDWAGVQNNGNLPGGGIQSLIFTVTGASILTLDSGLKQGTTTPPIFAVVDIVSGCTAGPPQGCLQTGNVGATLGGGVPEPATWAMMLTGFFGMGGLLRRRRALAVAA